MAICKNCGQQVDDNATFCGKCGSPVSAAGGTIICANCGNEIPKGMIFCDKCGQIVEPPKPAPRPVPPAPVPAPIPRPVPPMPAPTPSPSVSDNAKTLSIWGIVFAVLAPIIAWNWNDVLGLVLCFTSVVVGIRSKKAAAIAAGVISAFVVICMFIYAYS